MPGPPLDTFAKGLKLTLVHEGRIVEQVPPVDRPAGNLETGAVRYAVDGQIASAIDIHARQLLQKSCFVIATNDTRGAVLSDEQVLEAYREAETAARLPLPQGPCSWPRRCSSSRPSASWH